MDLHVLLVDGQHNHVLEHDVADAMRLLAAVLPHDNAVLQVAEEDRVMLHHRLEVVEERLKVFDVFRSEHFAEALEIRKIC